MKINIVKFAVAASMLATLAIPLSAQASAYMDKNINHRLHHQHVRIEKGVKTHALSRRERERVASNAGAIRRSELRDNLHNGGRGLTKGEHSRLEHRLNKNSGKIYKLKHNHNVAP